MRASSVVAGGGPALLLLGALVPGLRPLIAVVLLAGWIWLLLRHSCGALAAGGAAAGMARWKFGALWIPIGIHVGADIALYVGLACRAAA